MAAVVLLTVAFFSCGPVFVQSIPEPAIVTAEVNNTVNNTAAETAEGHEIVVSTLAPLLTSTPEPLGGDGPAEREPVDATSHSPQQVTLPSATVVTTPPAPIVTSTRSIQYESTAAAKSSEIEKPPGPCIVKGYSYTPAGSLKLVATDVEMCQTLCYQNIECAHFSFWPDGSCVLSGRNAALFNSSQECANQQEANTVKSQEHTCDGIYVLSGPKACRAEHYSDYPALVAGIEAMETSEGSAPSQSDIAAPLAANNSAQAPVESLKTERVEHELIDVQPESDAKGNLHELATKTENNDAGNGYFWLGLLAALLLLAVVGCFVALNMRRPPSKKQRKTRKIEKLEEDECESESEHLVPDFAKENIHGISQPSAQLESVVVQPTNVVTSRPKQLYVPGTCPASNSSIFSSTVQPPTRTVLSAYPSEPISLLEQGQPSIFANGLTPPPPLTVRPFAGDVGFQWIPQAVMQYVPSGYQQVLQYGSGQGLYQPVAVDSH